ncbi:MAG: acyltransferase family protein [Bacteroidaceae bacterium]|nr:acyltransferase family protein [Bacteroidaceae bacterium]
MSTSYTQAKKRSLSIDMVKGLSIMTLFFLHFENGWMNCDYNYFIVRSPAFYIVVGWLWGMSSNKKTIKGHWEKRKKGLVKPYIWLSLIFIIFDAIMVLMQLMDIRALGRDIFKTLSLRGIGTLWFLPALLGGEILFIYLSNRNKIIKSLAYVLCFILIVTINIFVSSLFSKNETLHFITYSLTRVIKDICDTFIYISIAYYISKAYGKNIFNLKKGFQFSIGLTLLSIAFYIFNFVIGKYTSNEIIETAFFMIANCCSGFGILLFFKSIEQFKPFATPLSYCGRNSLTIMAFHFCLLFQIVLIFNKAVMGNNHYYGEITIIYFLIAVILQIGIIELINRKFPFIIGKD